MATNRIARTRGIRHYGPGGVELLTCDFTTSGTTADVTTNEANGCTVARTGVGQFTVTFGRSYKSFQVGMSVQAATTAQLFKIGSRTTSSFVIDQVTAGGGTAVDTLAARVNLVIHARTVS